MIKNSKGITLIELIATMGIVAIIFTLLTPMMFSGFQYFSRVNNMVIDQTEVRKIMVDLSRETRDGLSVTVDSDTQLTIDDVIYKYENQEITKNFSDGTSVVISENIEYFRVLNPDGDTTVIQFEVRAEGAANTLSSKVRLRQRALPTPEIA